jgi:uncharacterized alpha-E superfamily protein
MVELFDSTITFHAQYQQSRDLAALIDLLVLDRDNPRSLAWITHTMRGRLAKLAGRDPEELSALSLRVPDPSNWNLAQLCETQINHASEVSAQLAEIGTTTESGYYFAMNDLLLQCVNAAFNVSEEISTTYFTHSAETKQSMGTS